MSTQINLKQAATMTPDRVAYIAANPAEHSEAVKQLSELVKACGGAKKIESNEAASGEALREANVANQKAQQALAEALAEAKQTREAANDEAQAVRKEINAAQAELKDASAKANLVKQELAGLRKQRDGMAAELDKARAEVEATRNRVRHHAQILKNAAEQVLG